MKTQTQKFSQHLQQQQIIDSPPTTMTQYLTIIRNFILQMHQRVNQQFDPEVLPTNLTQIIDKAAIKLKTNKEQLSMLQKQNRNLQNTKIMVTQLKAEQSHMQKRFGQKNDEISILRQTVKTLYSDNERLNGDKQKLSKQLVSVKQLNTQCKKKLKKQQQQMTKHKHQLQKLTKIAQQRLGQYAGEDKQKQKSIKKLTNQIDRLRNENDKSSRQMQQIKRQNEQLLKIKIQYENVIKLIQTIKNENSMIKRQKQSLILSLQQKSRRFTQQLLLVRTQLSQQSQKTLTLSLLVKELQMNKQTLLIKIKSYEQDIMIRVQKLKQKNQQINKYDQQISKLLSRIQSLSQMSNQIIKDNQLLNHKYQLESQKSLALQQRLEQGRIVQQYVQKIKGQLNYNKSIQITKLIQALGTIRGRM